jgi:hypothetical protein
MRQRPTSQGAIGRRTIKASLPRESYGFRGDLSATVARLCPLPVDAWIFGRVTLGHDPCQLVGRAWAPD